MHHARTTILFTALLVALTAAGCETTGLVGADGGGTDTGAGDRDVGPVDAAAPPAITLSYTPDGCAYPVSTPVVTEAARSEDTFGAAPTPDYVHISWAGPSDTTFAVNWHSDRDTLASSLLIGTDSAAVMAADDAATGVARHDGHHMLFSSAASGIDRARAHEVHVCGLTPSTTYFYRVGGPGHWSRVFEVSTAPVAGSTEPFSFGVTGDSRGYEDNAFAISQHRLLDRAVDFELFSGDAVVIGSAQAQWDQFFTQVEGTFSVEDFLATRPLMMANGNHDLLSVNYLAQFALPQDESDGEIGQGEEWYSFDYGNAHFVVLNDTVLDDAILGNQEAAWLDADLAAVDRTMTPWVFVMHHRPFYTCQSTHSPDTSLRAAWQPIFDRYHVDFVLAGHNHVYERSAPIQGLDGSEGRVAPQGANGIPVISAGVPSGTIYMVAAGVGAPLYPVNTTCPTSLEGESVRNYVVFEVADRTIHMTAYDALTNTVLDEIEYTK